MWDWFFPSTCPCDPPAKRWIETRLQWLSVEFDDHAFNGRRIVLPTSDFFPDRYDATEAAVWRLLRRVCGYMDVDPDSLEVEFVSDVGRMWLVNDAGRYIPSAAGTYQESGDKFLITIDRYALDDPMELVGTLAHELAHVRLLGERRVSPDVYDNELLTDLTVVFFGLGIFLANVPRFWPSQVVKYWPRSELRKPEYMTPPLFGYALAHLAWFRGETKPTWARFLRWDAQSDFRRSLRFLNKTGDSSFRPVRLRDTGKDKDKTG